MPITEFEAIPTSVGNLDPAHWNWLLDHGLVKPISLIVYYDAVTAKYRILSGNTGKVLGTPNATLATVQQEANDLLVAAGGGSMYLLGNALDSGVLAGLSPGVRVEEDIAGILTYYPASSVPQLGGVPGSGYMANKLKAITPTQSGWGTAPTTLANVTDEKESTVTGTGNTVLGAAGVVGYIIFDLGQKMRCLLTAKVGIWASAGTAQVRWQWSDDNTTWSQLTEFDAAQNYGTSEGIRYLRMEYCDARYIRLRFYGSAAATVYAKVYEAWALQIGASETGGGGTGDPTRYIGSFGGYLTTALDQAGINAIMNDLNSDGGKGVRYWCFQNWYRVLMGYDSTKEYNQVLADWIVARAVTNNQVVYIDCSHNYPPDPYNYIENPKGLGTSYETQWKTELLAVGLHHNANTNVVLEIVNESWHLSPTEEKALLNRGIAYLRAGGCHLPLNMNLSWTLSDTLLTDPNNNYSINRHMYCPSWLGSMLHSGSAPWDLESVAAETPDPAGHPGVSINSLMDKIFVNTSETYYVQRAIALGIPNGMTFTEVGTAPGGTYLDTPRTYGICWNMMFVRRCKTYGVPTINYRIGNADAENRKPTYLAKALADFGVSFYPP